MGGLAKNATRRRLRLTQPAPRPLRCRRCSTQKIRRLARYAAQALFSRPDQKARAPAQRTAPIWMFPRCGYAYWNRPSLKPLQRFPLRLMSALTRYAEPLTGWLVRVAQARRARVAEQSPAMASSAPNRASSIGIHVSPMNAVAYVIGDVKPLGRWSELVALISLLSMELYKYGMGERPIWQPHWKAGF